MASNSGIEWTDASWNCLAGCEAISPGCAHCYAATMTRRLEAMGQADYTGLTTAKHFNGKVRCLPDKLDIPLRWRKPRRVFVNSMSDLFHEDVPDEFIRRVFAVMSLAGQHTFQVLTKRAERMAGWFADDANCLSACQAEYTVSDEYPRTPTGKSRVRNGRAINGTHKGFGDGNYWPLPNVQLGISAEDQPRADERTPWLLKTPAAVRFVSAEPLIGGINFRHINLPAPDPQRILQPVNEVRFIDALTGQHGSPVQHTGGAIMFPGDAKLDWVIVGGESGHGARPCNIYWIRDIVRQCKTAGVRCFVKQLGGHPFTPHPGIEWEEYDPVYDDDLELKDKKGGDPSEWPADLRVRQFPAPTP